MFFGLSAIKRRVRRAIRVVRGVSEPSDYKPHQVNERLESAEEEKGAEYKSKRDEGSTELEAASYASTDDSAPLYGKKKKKEGYLPDT